MAWVLVPLTHNDGTRVSNRRLNAFITKTARAFNGLTAFGPGLGIWLDNGKEYFDEIIPIMVISPRSPTNLQKLAQIGSTVARELRQKEVWVIFHPVSILSIRARGSMGLAVRDTRLADQKNRHGCIVDFLCEAGAKKPHDSSVVKEEIQKLGRKGSDPKRR